MQEITWSKYELQEIVLNQYYYQSVPYFLNMNLI